MKTTILNPLYLLFCALLFIFFTAGSCNVPVDSADPEGITAGPLGAEPDEGYNESASVTKATTAKIVALVWDGAANQKRIDKAFYTAMDNVSSWSAWRKYWLSGGYDIADAKKRVNDMVNAYGISKSKLICLLIGKSLGGAKIYRMIAKNESFFDDFARVAVVLVDPHEPGAPGDEGRCNYWYDYVKFRCHSSDWNGNYDLAWQSVWDNMIINRRLEFYSIYQRGSWPRGYKFTDAGYCWRSSYDHYDIADCSSTVRLIEYAVKFILNK
jgi:hypothetical protein